MHAEMHKHPGGSALDMAMFSAAMTRELAILGCHFPNRSDASMAMGGTP